MKKISKILSIIMTLVMVISIFPMSNITSSASTYTDKCGDNLIWTFYESTGNLSIFGTGAMYDYVDGDYPWKGYSIKTVVIGDGVTTIGYDAFSGCAELTSVTISDSVTTIGGYAFGNCDSLTRITVDGDNQYYSNDEYGVLFNKDKTTLIQYPIGNTRTNYIVPDSVIRIGGFAFSYSANLTNIIIGNSVREIDWYAFSRCDSLTSVTIGESVTTIGYDAFSYCTSLTSLTIPDNVTTIASCAFRFCNGLANVIIGNSVTEIRNDVFYSCTSLTSVTIPGNVKIIGDSAFDYCDSLSDVYYNGTEGEWNKISIERWNEDLLNANIHFNNCKHIFSNWSTVSTPTCTKTGLEKRVCSECGKEETKVISEVSHKYNSVITNPTCTKKGYTTFTCTECGYSYVGNYVKEKGHTYAEIVTSSTCTQNGYTTYTCECGDTYIKNMIPAAGHEDLDIDAYCDNCDELLCDHNCHKGGIVGFFWKITNFFNRIFGSNKECSCGVAHY